MFSQYLGSKVDMLFETATTVKIVIILGEKQLYYPKIVDFIQNNIFYCYPCPHKFTDKANFFKQYNSALNIVIMVVSDAFLGTK